MMTAKSPDPQRTKQHGRNLAVMSRFAQNAAEDLKAFGEAVERGGKLDPQHLLRLHARLSHAYDQVRIASEELIKI